MQALNDFFTHHAVALMVVSLGLACWVHWLWPTPNNDLTEEDGDEYELEGLGCPCIYTEPCNGACPCAPPYLKGLCTRCCSEGTPEERKEQAKKLARFIDKGWQEEFDRKIN